MIFPLFHTGRPWRAAYWLFPIPNTDLHMWQNFRSPLLWDVFAVIAPTARSRCCSGTSGLIPDLATLRDRATDQGSARCLRRRSASAGAARPGTGSNYEKAYLILAGISTPLVLSVHTIVRFDFATSVIPGWHTTIFPPYFVAGAIFSGFAMVMTLLVIARWAAAISRHLITHASTSRT